MPDETKSALPCSRSALDQLGHRLAIGEEDDPRDLELLRSVLAAYDDVLAQTEERIRSVLDGFTSSGGPALGLTTRVKTTGTIREKLQREHGMGLKGMQDVAGVRVTGALSRRQQNELAAAIQQEFSDAAKAPRLSDRRVHPSAGYRALHVIVFPRHLPVEVQIRTVEQDAWAQLIEKLGDVWGRGIRYGEQPTNTEQEALRDMSRGDLLEILMRFSDGIEDLSVSEFEDEELADRLADHQRRLTNVDDELGKNMEDRDTMNEIEAITADIAVRMAKRDQMRQETQELLERLARLAAGWETE
ncbi:nucleotidyltransferase family protein [Aeromicrobium fastidiosum]|uniref:RelA/SpoT domain-containing protein n=1 Tax=Aeromicrobium fastidiosum TaxID=52699 RepID=A0A641ATJ6_9ACTN|nr:hypothetical protein [Aeromicrobium fastidiosum]KAA1380563.1 hypothetical protein ESP62_005125 [Aeromicrobium fastidiosum]MBP2390157.1 ppGpp synthetase/RelA/SpoT-type nucleotidyltransferase [Aeromicrobium fastidiosum]